MSDAVGGAALTAHGGEPAARRDARPRRDDAPHRTESVDAFVARARAWLDSRAQRRPDAGPTRADQRPHPDRVPLLEEIDPETHRADLQRAKDWRRELFDAGFGWITGPPALGGAGLTDAHDRAFAELCAEYRLVDTQPLLVGLHILAPALDRHGSAELRARYLPALHRGELVGCQLFSEPGAGSDLAGVRTRAERDDATGDWILNGQKVWSSSAADADLGEALVRTDAAAPKHRGLSLFLVDLHAPGVTVRPIRQITGGSAFNEVFLDGVRVPADHCLGGLGQGWRVASVSLASERAALGGAGDALPDDLLERLTTSARRRGLERDALLRQHLARVHTCDQILAVLNGRGAHQSPVDAATTASIAKLLVNRHLANVVTTLGLLLGPSLVADTGEWGTYAWAEFLLGTPALRIAGGTDEIQHDILAERALGLPRTR